MRDCYRIVCTDEVMGDCYEVTPWFLSKKNCLRFMESLL